MSRAVVFFCLDVACRFIDGTLNLLYNPNIKYVVAFNKLVNIMEDLLIEGNAVHQLNGRTLILLLRAR